MMRGARTMPRNPTRSGVKQSENCSDCGAPEPNWASVNRGVLICNDCASVHMSLGRHISQVKHLHKSQWHPNMQSMVQHLVSAGANSIWEHSLLDPAQMRSGKRKPNPSDNIHPTKAEFIKSKYLNLLYVHRLPYREDEHTDISKQLHSSVRTGNLETSLRLLSQGAHANFFNTERGNTPLHVAAKAGQSLQVELLVAYGADPGTHDSNNKTPEDLARAEKHNELADRLVELHYELSDRFTEFVCNQTPDHKAGKHYILPKIKDSAVVSQEGKRRLKALNNQTFEELAVDVYDEVDRRESEKIWQDVQKSVLIPGRGTNPALQTELVPFLPVHPDYSTTRNQGRQKLAIFKDTELNNLIADILHDIARRQQLLNPISSSSPDEDPIYDIPPDEDQELDCRAIERSIEPPKEMVPKEEFVALEKKLEEKDTQIAMLLSKVTDLAKQNHDLTRKLQALKTSQPQAQTATSTPQSQPKGEFPLPARVRPQSPGARPSSVYNPNDSSGSQSSLHSSESSELRRRTIHVPSREEAQSPTLPVAKVDASAKSASQCSSTSEYDNNAAPKDETAKQEIASASETQPPVKEPEIQQNNVNANNNLPQLTAPLAQPEPESPAEEPHNSEPDKTKEKGAQSNSSSPHSQIDAEETVQVTWPEPKILEKKTELLTRMIQSLYQTAKKVNVESYLERAENVLSGVSDVVALFEKPHSSALSSILQQISGDAHKLCDLCKETSEAKNKADNHKQLTELIIARAFSIAKAEKQLMTMASGE